MFQTEVEFTLPCGFQDETGTLHRDGVMRRATAGDEIWPLRDPRVLKNPAYLIVILLSRVVTRLGSIARSFGSHPQTLCQQLLTSPLTGHIVLSHRRMTKVFGC